MNPFERMNAAARSTDEWPFKMNPQNFRTRIGSLMLERNIFRDSFRALADGVWVGGDRSGNEGSSPVGGDGLGDNLQSFFRGLHNVMSTSAVNMHVDKSRCGNPIGRVDLPGAGSQGNRAARPHIFNDTVANQNGCILKFCRRGEGAPGMKKCCGHKVICRTSS